MFGIDITHWVATLGYVGILFIIFIETGLFVGFFLPGDSLLFAAGFLASQNLFNLWILLPAMLVVAIAGYFLAYWFGEKLGNWLMKRKDSLWFKKRYLLEAKQFYDKHGGKALILGRLIPILRTFVPIVAGMTKMTYMYYAFVNVVGAIVWIVGVTLAGYWLGNLIPNADQYILPIILLIILVSLLPAFWHFLRRSLPTNKNKS